MAFQRAKGAVQISGSGGSFSRAKGAVQFAGDGVTSALTGTASPSITEADVVTGGKTSIITLTGDTWIAAGTGPIGTTAQSNAIIAQFDSAQSETNGWDAEVTGVLVRTSSTIATITWSAAASYDITATETITPTDIANAVLTTSVVDVAVSGSFTVTAISSSSLLLLDS